MPETASRAPVRAAEAAPLGVRAQLARLAREFGATAAAAATAVVKSPEPRERPPKAITFPLQGDNIAA